MIYFRPKADWQQCNPISILSMEELLAYLDAIAPLSPALRNHITGLMKVQKLRRKAYLIKAGKINRGVHFVVKGLIRCYKLNGTGKEINKWFFAEDDFIAYRQSYDKGIPSAETYQALKPSVVLTTTFAELDAIYARYPEFLRHALFITGRFASLWYNVNDIKSGLSAHERYRAFMHHYPELFQRIPNKYLASFLNMHEATISKIRAYR